MAHTLETSDGNKTVYVRFRDAVNNQSTQITDTITLDSTAPTVPTMTAEPAYTS